VTCTAVRDRLAEHALGVLATADLTQVDRHLAWCAACRKEADGLNRAAGSLTFALAPVEPAPELEERIVEAIAGTVGGRRTDVPRRGRLAVAAVVAAMLALSGLGWGAVMAGRADRLQKRIEQAEQRQSESIVRIRTIFRGLEFGDGKASLALLATVDGGAGGGAALTVTSDSIRDIAIVQVLGLRVGQGPFMVELAGHDGDVIQVGRITHLDVDGGGTLIDRFDEDLEAFQRIIVRGATGGIILQGILEADTGLATPSPAPDPGR
jgi:hypothetical protein